MMPSVQILVGDCLESLRAMPDESVQCCVTSPPYFGLRDYGHAGQIGLEPTPDAFVAALVGVFHEVRRVLRDDGTLWLNLGDSYAGSGRGAGDVCSTNKNNGASRGVGSQLPAGLHENARLAGQVGRAWVKPPAGLKAKDLIGIPWRVAFALQADGWYLRSDIIWSKLNPMPESVADRCTKAHEYLFMLAKAERYYFDADAINEPCETPMESKSRCAFGSANGKCNTTEFSHSNETGKRWEKSETRNKRTVWTVATSPYSEAHFATFPPKLIQPCILAGTKTGDVVLDPFGGSGTTGMVALELGRSAILCELNPAYAELARLRCNVTPGLPL